MTKRLKDYLRDLAILGVGATAAGGFFIYLLLQTNHSEDWAIAYLPLKIIGVVFAYLLVTYIAPGGNVNYYFTTVHTPNEDEKLLNKLIAKYNTKLVIKLLAAGYILADILLGRVYYNMGSISFDGIFGYLVMTTFYIGVMMQGLKYISAWWNIQKVLRKDRSGESLLASVKNDPVLAKLDNPKPIINLPKILKKFWNKL